MKKQYDIELVSAGGDTSTRRMTAAQKREQRVKASNTVNTLHPYRDPVSKGWYYDDEDLGVYKEAFVMGSSEVIDHLVGKDCNSFTAHISHSKIPAYTARLKKLSPKEALEQEKHLGYEAVDEKDSEPMQGWYRLEGTEMVHWLCGCVLDYFTGYPANIYVKIVK